MNLKPKKITRTSKVAVFAAAATACLFGTLAGSGAAQAAPQSTVAWGVFNPEGHTASDLEKATGKRPATQLLFHNFSDESMRGINGDLNRAWNQGSVPVLTLEFTNYNDPNAPYDGAKQNSDNSKVDRGIATGKMDHRIDQVADNVRSFISGPDGRLGTKDDRKAYIRPGHEMNGNWYRWSATSQQSPQDYINAFKHIHEHFDAKGLGDRDSIQFMWIPMACGDSGLCKTDENTSASSYYPGDDVVDWVGVDGYNWGSKRKHSTWESPEKVLKKSLDEVSDIVPNEPIAIPEVGTPTNGSGDKNQWMRDLYYFTSFYDHNGHQVKQLSYFNIKKEESGKVIDWRVLNDAGDTRFPEFISGIKQNNVFGGGNDHLTTDQFQGKY